MPHLAHGALSRPSGVWNPTTGSAAPTGRCRPSCCKTPHGHSVVRDAFPKGDPRACTCHPKEDS